MSLPTEADAQKAIARYEAPLPDVIYIENANDYEQAADDLKQIKGRIKDLEAERKEITRPLDEAKRRIMALFDTPVSRLTKREAAIKNAITSYQAKLEHEARLLEARLRDEQAAEAAKAEERAAVLRAKGREEQAEAVLANVSPVPIVVVDRPAVPGISTRVTWKAEVTDIGAFAAWCLNHGTQSTYLVPNQQALNAYARALRRQGAIPGVRFYSESTIAARST